jgi:hypothetical protein
MDAETQPPSEAQPPVKTPEEEAADALETKASAEEAAQAEVEANTASAAAEQTSTEATAASEAEETRAASAPDKEALPVSAVPAKASAASDWDGISLDAWPELKEAAASELGETPESVRTGLAQLRALLDKLPPNQRPAECSECVPLLRASIRLSFSHSARRSRVLLG